MNTWTLTHRRLGMWSALSMFVISGLYVATGVAWLLSSAAAGRDRLGPVDPFLAILEALIVASAPPMVVIMAAVHAYAPRDKRVYSLSALAFMSLLAGTTCLIHFVRLTAVRRLDPANASGLVEIFSFQWPSAAFAGDLLVWDLFLGLCLLFAAPVFRGGRLHKAVRVSMRLSGVLCIVGLLGPTLGDLRFQYPAIFGYAGVFPIVCLLLAILFARSKPDETQSADEDM